MTANRIRRLLLVTALAALALAAGSCGGVIDDAGHGSSRIADLWWVMFWLSTIPVFVVTVIVVRILIHRRPRGSIPPQPEQTGAEDERGDRRLIVLGGIAFPLALLIPVAVMTIAVGNSREARPDPGQTPLQIQVTAHQFWWDIEYPAGGDDTVDGATFRTANEIHIPVGRPVEIIALAEDVIHSFWVPELDGKIDMIPGHRNTLTIQADRPGTYIGRCAEFCGLGHTTMRLMIIAEEPEQYDEWYARESMPFAGEIDQGLRQDFGNSCGPCHVIRGLYDDEAFAGDFGPDLTHLANRSMLAAGAMSNTRETLGRWIADPQGVKPGNRMPDVNLDGETLGKIVDFLQELR